MVQAGGQGGAHADAATFDTLAKALAGAENDEQRNRLAHALVAVRDPALAAAALRISLSPPTPSSATGCSPTSSAAPLRCAMRI
jgi:hypothetical protein